VPARFGTKGIALTLVILGAINVILGLIFRLLVYTGAMDYALIPVAVPEVSMVGAPDRITPLNVFWSALPVLEYILALLIWGALCVYPLLLAVFLRAVALSMRNEDLEQKAQGMVRMSLGVTYALLAYLMVSVTGTSDVLQWVLRVVYALWAGFFMGMLAVFAITHLQVPALIDEELDESEAGKGRDEEDEEDEEEDERD
jgi:hypothetical protein